ncbi:ABC transporter substrate-binding protein [Ferrimicrobium sp.]|uniref:ABC transporter substrate-binding protein n=1 Tax=Ferrimicrobium sp. TaxID=2926050 RepID=UPI00261588AC|nr:ABC transporter substrate-binding protein [Ferrimicrobium sp.]
MKIFNSGRFRLGMAMVVAAGIALSACGSSSTSSNSSSSSKTTSSKGTSSQVLTMESSPTNPISRNFNPFLATSAAQLLGATSMIYEPLYQFDLAKPTVSYPWLATSYQWNSNGTAITFTIRKGVKWSNGSALTPADVAFTYNLVKQYPDINGNGLTISSVSVSGDTVTIAFPTPQYTNLQGIANVPIVPEAIWSKVGDPGKYQDPNPVGSGPYKLTTFTPEGITLTRNPLYWQPVHVQTLEFPVYSSNTTALEALETNQAQWAGNFITGLNKLYISPDPSHHKAWFNPENTVSLIPNLHTWPTDQLPVRQAISDAIDRNAISADGESGLEPPVTNLSGLVLPTFKSYSTPALAKYTVNDNGSPQAADTVLKNAGYTIGSNGYYQLNGKTVTIQVTDPSSYSDYAADDEIVAADLQKAHIDATFVGQSVSAWSSDVASGNFQLTEHWSAQGITPYQQYDGWLASSLATTAATGDYERLNDPAINADLANLAQASTLSQQRTALVPIATYVATNLPVIPTVYGAAFDEYNDTNFVGWPTPSNPYESGQPDNPTNEVVVLHLSPRS